MNKKSKNRYLSIATSAAGILLYLAAAYYRVVNIDRSEAPYLGLWNALAIIGLILFPLGFVIAKKYLGAIVSAGVIIAFYIYIYFF